MDNTYEGLIENIKCLFKRHSATFFEVGQLFKILLQSRLYVSFYSDFKTCVKTEFKMSVQQVYSYIAVFDRFNYKPEYSDYSFSQLLELVYVPIGTTLSNLNTRLHRQKFTPEELEQIAEGMGAKYVYYFEFPDGTKI